MDRPEQKSTTEPLDLQRKIADTVAGKRPIDERAYPYFPPDYNLPFPHIGTERQLFVDNFMLDHLDGVVRVFPSPDRPDRPIVEVGELPWERYNNPLPAAAIYDPDDDKFKLWYTQSLIDDPFSTSLVLCYAESCDCLHWEKPLSEQCLPYENHNATNIVQRDATAVTVVLNHDQSDPNRKFLMLYCPSGRAREEGKRIMSAVAASSDGLRWTTFNEDTPYRHQHESRIIWDEAIQKWVAYSQYSHHWNFLYRKRQIGRQESKDFIHWSPKEVILSSDWAPDLPPHLEFHDMSVRKVGGLYVGIPGEIMAEPLWCVGNDTNWRDHFYGGLGLYCSRDGKRWHRAGSSGPWVENRGPGSIDHGIACFTVAGQLQHAGKTYIPYLARPDKQHWFVPTAPCPIVPAVAFERAKHEWEILGSTLGRYPRHRSSVGVLVLREDGWAELKPAYEHGRVYTKQFVFEGDTLRINADCVDGYIQVEILDPSFKPYAGFSADECDPGYTDDPSRIWHTVHWQGQQDLRSLWNKPCRLRFHLHQASLYAFQFVETRQS